MPKLPDAMARLREAGVAEPGWHLRKLKAAAEEGGDLGAMVQRVCAGEPVHRVIGAREVGGHTFAIGPDTLEPRDDTMALTEIAFHHAPVDARFADLGTGTGLVGLSLAWDLPGGRGVLTDVSEGALAVARANAERLRLADQVAFAHGSWFEPLEGTFDAIVSNPPYIRTDVIPTLDPSVRDHDPHLALDGGADGLDAYRAILSGAATYLREGGFVALEIGFDQRDAVSDLAHGLGWHLFDHRRDMGGHVRALAFRPA